MNLRDLPAAIDDPVDAILGFHRRIERQLATLGRLPGQMEDSGVHLASIASAASALDFFSRGIELHHADEEDLLRVLHLCDLAGSICADHREMDRTWRSLCRPLQAIAEGLNRKLPVDLIDYFRASHGAHIAFEEARLHCAAAHNLRPNDRAALSRSMAARRTRTYRFE